MVWDIGSTLISKKTIGKKSISKKPTEQQFRALRNRLLLSYLLIITVILGSFSIAVYILVARDRNQQLNSYLQQVAATAASSLDIIQHEYLEFGTGKYEYEHEYKLEYGQELDDVLGDEQELENGLENAPFNVPLSLSDLMDKYNSTSNDQEFKNAIEAEESDPANRVTSPLALNDQGVEWFNAEGQIIVQEGSLFTDLPLPTTIMVDGQVNQSDHVRSFVQPVYRNSLSPSPRLLGYVRASESTLQLEQDLRRLQERLALGVMIVSGLITGGGMWLTRESIQPVLTSFEQLKQFTSDASHELRNPLTAIRASIAVMQSHPERIHPDDVDKIKAIASASAQMSTLVDDLLLLARMDQTEPNQHIWRRLPLDEILEDLVNLYGDRAYQANIALRPELAESLEVVGDASQLQRLFTNLLSNALQYTPSGGSITVTLQQNGGQGVVEISDTGIGIAPEQIPHLFDRFWRADRARQHHDGGAGLGLAIAQAIAQCHGGKITVQSQLGQGSCFQVRIPLV